MPEGDVGFTGAKTKIDLLTARADVGEVDESLVDALHDYADRIEPLEDLHQALELAWEVALAVRSGASEVAVAVDVEAATVELSFENDELLDERLNFGQRDACFLQKNAWGGAKA